MTNYIEEDEYEKYMYENLHTTGKICFNIYNKALALTKLLPSAFKMDHRKLKIFFDITTDLGVRHIIVERHLGESIFLTYSAVDPIFKYSEYYLNGYKIRLSHIDEKTGITASNIHNAIMEVDNILSNNLKSHNEYVSKLEKELELM